MDTTYTMYIFIAFIYFQLTLSKYVNETIVVNVELTIFTAIQLNISDNNIQTEISTAYLNTNTETRIFDTDKDISMIYNYNYLNEDDNFEFMAIFYVYFQSENDYDAAINKYTTDGFIDSFIIEFENNIQSQLFGTISNGNSFNEIQKVLINSMKLIKLDIDDNIGSMLIKYNGDTTTTSQPTISISPSISPTISPTKKEETQIITTIIMKEGNTANYTFDSDAPYWGLLVFFLFIGCCFGCCCWYIFCIKYPMFDTFQKYMEEEGKKPVISNKRQSNSRSKKQTNNGHPIKQTSSKRNVDVTIEMGSDRGRKKKKKKTPKTPKGPNKGKGKNRNKEKMRNTKSKKVRSHTFDDTKSIGSGREEGKEEIDDDPRTDNKKKLNNKRERYIEYGSDDDSDQSERVFAKKMPKSTNLRPRPQSVIIHKSSYNDEVTSSDDDINNDNDKQQTPKNKKRYSYSTTPSDETKGTTPRPKKRNKNKKTGNVEPDRYDDDGNRILTTKELMAQYKKTGATPSVELSYKVGGQNDKNKKKRKKRRDDDDDEEDEEDESMGDTGDEYEFDVDSNSVDSSTMSGINHPHYRPSQKQQKQQQHEANQQQKQKRKKLERINEKEKEKKRRDRKKKGNNNNNNNKNNNKNKNKMMRHKRSATSDLGRNRRSRSGGPRKKKLSKKRVTRPESARFKDHKYNKPIKMKRPQSAKPRGREKKRRVEREFYDNNRIHTNNRDEDEDDEDEEDDDDETPEPKRFNQNNNINYDNNNDQEDDDESSSYYE